MKKLFMLLALLGLMTAAHAQTYPGQIPSATVLGNNTGSTTAAAPVTVTSLFDQAYCSTIGFLLVRFTSVWTCAKYIDANPVWWGADPTGASDSTSALNSALAASTSVVFPAGTFLFNSAISYSFSSGAHAVTVRGRGPANTILKFGSTNGLLFTYASTTNRVGIYDLTIETTAANVGNSALGLSNTTFTGIGAQNVVQNVEFRGSDGPIGGTNYWGTDITVLGVSNVLFNFDSFWGSSTQQGIGINLFSSSELAIVFNVESCYFEGHQYGIQYGTNMQGLTVNQSNFNQDEEGIFVPSSNTNLSQLGVFNSQFNTLQNAIELQSNVPYVSIVGNMFLVNQISSVGYTGVLLTANAGFQVLGNTFSRNNSLSGQQGVVVGTTCATCGVVTGGGVITGNFFTGLATAVSLLSGSKNTNVQSNAYTSNTTNTSNTGTGNTIGGGSP